MQILSPASWATQPWRNGGGVTHEIVREGPPDAFLYRVSVADVATPGPFSRFAGVDRVITLLEGRGFVLRFADGREVSLTRPFEPFAFSGDDAVDCALVGGAVRDLNLMVDRERARLVIERVSVDATLRIAAGGSRLLVFVLTGELETTEGAAAGHDLLVTDDDIEAHAQTATELLVARVQWGRSSVVRTMGTVLDRSNDGDGPR